MPRYKINYNNVHFYKICCKDPLITDVYIGFTTGVKSREYHHKVRCIDVIKKHHYEYPYRFKREHGGWDNWHLVVIDTCNCGDILNTHKKHFEYMMKYKASLNKHVPPDDGLPRNTNHISELE
jgi:hypothetical protein